MKILFFIPSTVLILCISTAQAAVPRAVNAALADGLTDATTGAVSVLITLVAVAVLKYMRSAL